MCVWGVGRSDFALPLHMSCRRDIIVSMTAEAIRGNMTCP